MITIETPLGKNWELVKQCIDTYDILRLRKLGYTYHGMLMLFKKYGK